MIEFFINLLHKWSEAVPLPLFVVLGSFMEEIIAPIPSPIVMTLAGSLSKSHGDHVSVLLFLALIGAIAKSIGGYIIYILADKFEDVIVGRWGKYLGLNHKQLEAIGGKLGRGWKDSVALFLLRATPIMPTAPVSFAAGILKLNLKTYIISSAVGLFVRNMFYLYLGYTSAGALENLNGSLDKAENIGSVLVLAAVAGIFLYILKRKRDNEKKHIDATVEDEALAQNKKKKKS